ncbi:uncharacterized protein LOC111369366 isoform X2 [Olea europaea var. sylvestris]|uniref:Uncharacterized protein n=1 Tax=Olea europaea subsp. europaea TaxID=158383 RepID=A0A8S0QYC1_OLEEU|nr:uncharacterized protein LOC111369366 isoform X2 [Olea europaea var. sylvestris]CAA2971507.1 Hypothetical predicted protein [Olea europaea subsp. europaea]
MAEELYDGKFWLPPQFLTDDDLLMDFKNKRNDNFSFGFNGNSFGPNSDLSSPVESVTGSTETESDEDDYLSEVARKLLQSTLQDSKITLDNRKERVLSRSPQSTLCGAMGAHGSNFGSSGASPNCVSMVSSPPGVNRKGAADWDALYEAAGELARMRIIEETNGFYSGNRCAGEVFRAPKKLNPISLPLENPQRGSGFYPNQEPQLSYRQLQATQFQQLKMQLMMKQQQGSGVWGQGKGGYPQMVPNVRRNGGERTLPRDFSMATWPTLQQSQRQPGAGMRAMFLGDTGAKKERAGTGVFLPRRFGTPTETRKKPGCSTVLLPDRVVQALNLHLDNVDPQPQVHSRGSANCNPDYAAADGLKGRNNVATGQLMRTVRLQPAMNQELRLPQEWTY